MKPARVVVLLVVAMMIACGGKKDDASETGGSAAVKPEAASGKPGGVPTSREGQMYLLGQKLAQAAMVNGRADAGVVARTFKAASTIADITLQQQLAPLPPVTGDKASDTAEGMAYLLRGQGKALGQQIAAKFGEASAATYELALKINMLPMLYIADPKDSMGDTMAEVFGRLAAKAKLPDSALGPIIAKLGARAPTSEITDMALELNTSVPLAIAGIYEQPAAAK